MLPEYPSADRIPDLRQLWRLTFGDDDTFLDKFFGTAFSDRRCRCLMLEGQLAASLYWFDVQYQQKTYAYLYAVSTHPDFRHRGLIHYLMADTHQLLEKLGYAGALLVPADDGLRTMYAAMGYENCTTVSQFISSSLPVDIAMHSVDREEYPRLRRQLLPEDGVLQGNECLAFQETLSRFYTGPGFLLCCAAKNDSTLEGLEFLGDPAAAPGILCTLGYAHGSFRTPGEKIPHAMLLPLQKDCPRPGYLGLDFF